jgi:1,4-alpha-glucan branching enzyme
LLEDRWFDDTIGMDWSKQNEYEGILRMHRDLIALRRAADGVTRGLRGPNIAILRADDKSKVLAYHRWDQGGPGDDVVVVTNFADRHVADLRIGLPAPGRWRVRFNSDAPQYALEFGGHDAFDTDADGPPADGQGQSGLVAVGPYSLVVLSRED